MNKAAEKNPLHWKSHRQDYYAVHQWMYRQYGKASICEKCGAKGKKRYSWANLSGNYERDISDWIQLCYSCHGKMDFLESTRARISATKKGKMPSCVSLRKVCQYTMSGIYIATFESITSASRSTGIGITSIHNNVQGLSKSSGGFLWR